MALVRVADDDLLLGAGTHGGAVTDFASHVAVVGAVLLDQQSAGGEARALALTSDRRVQIARNAASMRWAGPRATHEGELRAFGIDCAVLEDGRRVLSRRGVGRALGSKHGGYQFRGGGEMPFFLSASYLKPFISEELATVVSKPVLYRSKSGGPLVHGIDARAFPPLMPPSLPRATAAWFCNQLGHLVRVARHA